MKSLFFVALAAIMLFATPSQAGFIMKKKPIAVEHVTNANEPAVTLAAIPHNNVAVAHAPTANEKQSFLSRLLKKVGPEISKECILFWQ